MLISHLTDVILEIQCFDRLQVFFSYLATVYPGVDVHGLPTVGVSADVLEYVEIHALIPHQRGEDGSVGVGCEFFVEPCFSLFHDSGFDSGLPHASTYSFSADSVAPDRDEEEVGSRVVRPDILESFYGLNGFLVDGDYGLFSAFSFPEADESVLEHEVVQFDLQCFTESATGLGQ